MNRSGSSQDVDRVPDSDFGTGEFHPDHLNQINNLFNSLISLKCVKIPFISHFTNACLSKLE